MIPKIDPEFKSLIPLLLEEERLQLEQNIVSSGVCRDAIVLWDGVVVDGHNRLEICMKHGIEFKIAEIEFPCREDAKVWILENQLGRRNLTDAARIEVALSKAELLREKARRNQSRAGIDRQRGVQLLSKTSKSPNEPLHVQKTLANEAGVSEGTLYNYMQIKQNAGPKLLSRVQSGEIKIGTAHRMLGKEILKQLRHADKAYAFIAKNIDCDGSDEIRGRLSELSNQLNALIGRFSHAKS